MTILGYFDFSTDEWTKFIAVTQSFPNNISDLIAWAGNGSIVPDFRRNLISVHYGFLPS